MKPEDIAQHRKWANEAIAAGQDKKVVSNKFKAETGQDL